MYFCDNCNEIVELLVSHFDSSKFMYGGEIFFEEYTCEVSGRKPSINDLFIISPRYLNTVFLIGEIYEGHTNSSNSRDYPVFDLYVTRGPVFRLDEVLGITLPGEIREKMTKIIKGGLLYDPDGMSDQEIIDFAGKYLSREEHTEEETEAWKQIKEELSKRSIELQNHIAYLINII